MPSAKRCESPESFHDWLTSAACAARTRRSRRRRGRRTGRSTPAPGAPALEALRELGVAGPAPCLGEEHEEERRCVDRPVVVREPCLRRAADAQLGRSCRARVDRRVVFARLQRGERLEGAGGELEPKSIVCRHVMSVSRPNTVMNQGIPAAGSRPRCRGRADGARRGRRRTGRSCARAAPGGAGAGCAGATLGATRARGRSVPNLASITGGSAISPERDGTTPSRAFSSRPERGSLAQAIRSRLGLAADQHLCDGTPRGSESRSCVPLACSSPCAALGSGDACRGSPRAKSCCLTEITSAKKLPNVSVSSNEASCMLTFRTRTTSVKPGPTKPHGRSRSCPARGSGPGRLRR